MLLTKDGKTQTPYLLLKKVPVHSLKWHNWLKKVIDFFDILQMSYYEYYGYNFRFQIEQFSLQMEITHKRHLNCANVNNVQGHFCAVKMASVSYFPL